MFFFIMLDAFSPTHSLIVVVDCCGLSNRSREVTLLLSSLMLLLDFERRAVLARCCMNCQKYDNFRSEQFVAKYRESLKGGPRLCENEMKKLRSPACSKKTKRNALTLFHTTWVGIRGCCKFYEFDFKTCTNSQNLILIYNRFADLQQNRRFTTTMNPDPDICQLPKPVVD